MPHLTVEYSANIVERDFADDLLARCHDALSALLPSPVANFKSRIVRHDVFRVGTGDTTNDGAFIHATLQIMPGRSADIMQSAAGALAEIMQNIFARSMAERRAQITVNIVELSPCYVKIAPPAV